MRPIDIIGFSALGCLVFGSAPASAGVVVTGTAVISGEADSIVGNQGNPATGQHISLSAAGTYILGPRTGSGGGNTTQGTLTIDLGSAPATLTRLPTITAYATGVDTPTSFDAAYTQLIPSLAYNFQVVGPQPAAVPVVFAGSTTGTLTSAGDPNRLSGHVGTRIAIVANGIGYSFAPFGAQTGTAPDALESNANRVNLGWGYQAFQPVKYQSYASDWAWDATLSVGEVGTITMSSDTEGGTTGQLRGQAVVTTSTATSMIDPRIFIDPAWLALHPGYSIVVDSAVGNGLVGSAVPEPSTWGMLLLGFAGLRLMGYRRAAMTGA
jgi:hypothetical protein